MDKYPANIFIKHLVVSNRVVYLLKNFKRKIAMSTITVSKGNRIDRELERLSKRFLALAPKVDNAMMMEASLITGDSHTSYWRYLNGEVKKIAVAKRMLDCLNVLIKKAA